MANTTDTAPPGPGENVGGTEFEGRTRDANGQWYNDGYPTSHDRDANPATEPRSALSAGRWAVRPAVSDSASASERLCMAATGARDIRLFQ
ncbi:hypothetical protein [Nocardia sp. SC052]|uniref:hypothetical protein n=1 Tax=Nocardia sichangensis TaxID=3385975 RepID=UPI0039A0B950